MPTIDPRVVESFNRLTAAQQRLATAEEELKAAKADETFIRTEEIPELLITLGLDNSAGEEGGIVFEDGTELYTERRLYVNVTKERRPEMIEWLIQNGYGAMVKNECSISFARNELQLAEVLRRFCRVTFPEYEIEIVSGRAPTQLIEMLGTFIAERFPKHTLAVEQTVHHSTLKSFVEKQLAAGVYLPECFGIFSPVEAVIRTPEQKEGGVKVAF